MGGQLRTVQNGTKMIIYKKNSTTGNFTENIYLKDSTTVFEHQYT